MNSELFAHATAYARGVLSRVTDQDLRRPTPCKGWDAGQVVLHLAEVIGALTETVEPEALARALPTSTPTSNSSKLVDLRLVQFMRAVGASTDPVRVDEALGAGAVELTTHSWDIGVSLDSSHRIPESLAEHVLAIVKPALHLRSREDNFAAALEVPGNATASERLVAFLGRAGTPASLSS